MSGSRIGKAALLTIVLLIVVGLIQGFFIFGDSRMEDYATFESPDGQYKIVVLRKKEFFGSAPGQAGDSPGEVRLINKNGDVIEKTDVEMVQLVENVEWTDKSVYIKLVADWKLPE